jgi:outer membrane protein OmpA-like peptidoglycan-associated protein
MPVRFHRFYHGLLIVGFSAALLSAEVSFYDRPLVNNSGQRGTVGGVYSAHTLGKGRVAIGLFGNGALDQSYFKRKDTLRVTSTGSTTDTTIDTVQLKPAISTFNLNPFVGAGVTSFCDLSLALPVHLDMLGTYEDLGFGDLQITAKFCTRPGLKTPLIDFGFIGAMFIPTGSQEKGFFPRHLYYFDRNKLPVDTASTQYFYTAGTADFETHVLFTLDLSALRKAVPLILHVNGGAHFSTGATNDNALIMKAGLEFRPWRSFAVTTDICSEMLQYDVSHGFNMSRGFLDVTPAICITPESGFMLTLGGEFSLAGSRTFTYDKIRTILPMRLTTTVEPRWRVFAEIGWNGLVSDRDSDHDGIFDQSDRCPFVPEDVDGFQDADGCPDFDNDNDGFPDTIDKCPNEAEDRDGFKDDDGCPDYDNDNDRIPDSVDQCPNAKEDYDGFLDQDGCPDYDNDRDGVPDSLDKCPNVPEDLDGFQDYDGCPDLDNDQDGIPDTLDKCPNQAGPATNGGCPGIETAAKPKAKEIKRGRVVLRGVSFEKGTATIDPNSYLILDDVVASLESWPEVQLEIIGHTDNTGNEAANIQTATQRAETVRNYLMVRGIAAGRLVAVGKGGSDPIADNATAPGRIMNNRIEIRRVDP